MNENRIYITIPVINKLKSMSKSEFSTWYAKDFHTYTLKIDSIFTYIHDTVKKEGLKSFSKAISFYLEDKEWVNKSTASVYNIVRKFNL